MQEISIKFDYKKNSKLLSEEYLLRDFCNDFCNSLNLNYENLYNEQISYLTNNSYFKLFGIDVLIPSNLLNCTNWICTFERRKKSVIFKIGDVALAAQIKDEEKLSYLPDDLILLTYDAYISLDDDDALKRIYIKNFKNLSYLCLKNSGVTNLNELQNLLNLRYLDLSGCDKITDINPIIRLPCLTELLLSGCKSICDISPINHHLSTIGMSLRCLDLSCCENLRDFSCLSGLSSLRDLSLYDCNFVSDISFIKFLPLLRSLILNKCKLINNLSPLSGLNNLEYLDLDGCESIHSLSDLKNLKSLYSISFNSRRIYSIEPLREISELRELSEFHTPEVAELLAHTACLRGDAHFILEKANTWLYEANAWKYGPLPLQDRFAATLGEAFSLLGETPIESAYEDFINSRPDFTSAPWKAWFGGTLKGSGFELFRLRVERVPVASMLSGAIGGACSTLPHEENAEWSREWLANLEEARLSDAKALLSVAPEICLAHARLGETEALGRWLVRFTDPSDPAALDPVQAALAGFQLAKGNLSAAENHIFAIQSPKLRDPVLADLVTVLFESDTEAASAKLLLIDSPAIRVESAKRLATKPCASETTLHRLAVAMSNSPTDLAELINAIPDPANKTFFETLSTKLQPDRSTTLRKIAEGLAQEAERFLAEAST